MRSFLRNLILFIITLFFLNFFFAHIAFNQVLHQFVGSLVGPKDTFNFSSYFSLWPKPSVNISEASYQSKQLDMTIDSIRAQIKLSPLVQYRKIELANVVADGMTLELPDKQFDKYFQQVVFKMIRQGLGVDYQDAKPPIDKYEINNFTLIRAGNSKQQFHIRHLYSNEEPNLVFTACFDSPDRAQFFNQTMLAKFFIRPLIKQECISFKRGQSLLPVIEP